MVYSMTAFSEHEGRTPQYTLRWEIRSLNSRYLDLILRLPDNLRFLEPEIRKQIGGRLNRGKVECGLKLGPSTDASFAFELNRPVAEAVVRALSEIDPLLEASAPVSPLEVARWPGVLQEAGMDRQAVEAAALESLEAALEKLLTMRQREGAQLAQFLRQRCEKIRRQVTQARQALPQALPQLRDKLLGKIREMTQSPDFDRLEQELVYLAQKWDVTEELDRLDTHLEEVDRLLTQDHPIGRRLDFLCQEMNREANTLAAKSASTALTQYAIEIKVLIEQMREQVQNIE
ncbi:MAG: YicC/YloC family endoribonuclease [Methylohalobius sp. ZOD2]